LNTIQLDVLWLKKIFILSMLHIEILFGQLGQSVCLSQLFQSFRSPAGEEAAFCWLNMWISNGSWFKRQAIQIPIPKLLPLSMIISVNWSEIAYLYCPRKMCDIFCYPVIFRRSNTWLTLALS